MKQYMIVAVIEGEQMAFFTDSYDDAVQAGLDICCSLAGEAEIYERVIDEDGHESYEFLED